MVAPLLTTKLHIPAPRPNLVRRERLFECLDRGLRRKVVLVSAPAGFGKTTLLAEWIQRLRAGESSQITVGWVSLDDGDNDPARFASYLTAALQRADRTLFANEGEPTDSSLQESWLVGLINRVAGRIQEFLLVLDDYHLITSPVVHDAMVYLVDHLPGNLHLAIATRSDPPWPLPRLRTRGQLIEVRQTDLRFGLEEAAVFLNSVVGLNLSPEDVATLERRTEGWIAGLQMAALSLQGYDLGAIDRAEYIAAFGGSHRFVLDYLVEEVLERQPRALQEFLLKTSILERLSGSLCDWLVGEEMSPLRYAEGAQSTDRRMGDSQSILEHLEAANLFIVALDDERRWYRYHRLFADLLQQRLRRAMPEAVSALHSRASLWHEQRGLIAAAIDHALAACDYGRAAHLIEEGVESVFMRSEVTTFLNWMEQLPDEWARARPTLSLYHTWALMMAGGPPSVVEEQLEELARAGEGTEGDGALAGRTAVLRAYQMLLKADWSRAAELCQQALQSMPEEDHFLRSLATWISSSADLVDQGLQDRIASLEQMVRMGQVLGNPLIAVSALCQRALLQMQEGRLHRAREMLEGALQSATDSRGRRLPIASEALISLGNLWREWNDLGRAERFLVEGIDLAKRWSELASFEAYYPLARVRLARGDVKAALATLEAGRQLALQSEITEVDDLIAELREAQFCVLRGDVEGAVRWAKAKGYLSGTPPTLNPTLAEPQNFVSRRLRKYELFVLARLFVLRGRGLEALELLETLSAQAEELGRVDLAIEIEILRALAHHAEGDNGRALDALTEALRRAEPGGFIRIFVDAGQPMGWLLQQAVEQGIMRDYAASLLASFSEEELVDLEPSPPTAGDGSLIDPLSDRELEVLRLLAAGLTNPEIADELIIAVSTVRSHCKNIYRKLDVHSRWDAAQRGQELRLL
jgi:LuxR family maltose regulon positive regulatory protein